MIKDDNLAAALALVNDAAIIVGPNGTVTSCNSAAERLYGYASGQIVGQGFALLLPAGSGVDPIEPVGDAVAEQAHVPRRCRDGTTIRVCVKRVVVRASDGQPEGILEVATAPFSAELAEQRFRLAVEACPAGMILVERNGAILFANVAAEQMFGYEREELVGRPVEQLVPDSSRLAHATLREEFVSQPGAHRMGHGRELKAIRQDQSQFQVEISLNTIPAHRGAYVLAVINDVTQRKIMQSEMQAQREELERSNRDLEQFAYVASHDLQEPLRMVARYTELLRERYQGKLDEKADTYIRFAVEGAKRMQQLVADTLAYSRVGSHGEPMAPVSIANVLRRVVVSLREPIRAAAARIEYGAMPTVIGDEIQINQLFQNLVGNAVKFRGAEPPVVTITAVPAGAEWLFAVADNGVGFEAEYSDEIFLMFQRLHARDRYEGTGIGLAIAKRIVERHGGRIWAESRPGQGSTFHFTLQASPDARCR